MTSLAFILGVAPLVVATGAGAEMRQSLGTAVFGGMLGVTGVRAAVHAGVLHAGAEGRVPPAPRRAAGTGARPGAAFAAAGGALTGPGAAR